MSDEYEENDIFVLLDFQGKETSKFFKQQNVYLRMLNLNENKPTIEIGDDVYEGTYDDAVGTNVFFEEIEDPPLNTNIFEGATPITLQYLLKQTKVLKMKKIGTKSKPVIDTSPTEAVNIHIQDDYRVLLEKFENSKLNIEDCLTVNEVTEINSEEEHSSEKNEDTEEEDNQNEKNFSWKASRLPSGQNLKPEWFTSVGEDIHNEKQTKQEQSSQIQINPIYLKYKKLQKLAEQPVRHNVVPEMVETSKLQRITHSLPKNDFIIWKNLVMRNVEQQTINLDVNKDKLEDFVDIEKSIQAGIISPSNENPRIFTKEEKQELLSFKNFINVSPLVKLTMLQDFIHLEQASLNREKQETSEVNKDGLTTRERLQLLKNFKDELKTHIISRIQDAHANDETLEKFEVVNLEFSNDEETSDTDFSYSSDDNDEQPSNSKGNVEDSEETCETEIIE